MWLDSPSPSSKRIGTTRERDGKSPLTTQKKQQQDKTKTRQEIKLRPLSKMPFMISREKRLTFEFPVKQGRETQAERACVRGVLERHTWTPLRVSYICLCWWCAHEGLALTCPRIPAPGKRSMHTCMRLDCLPHSPLLSFAPLRCRRPPLLSPRHFQLLERR